MPSGSEENFVTPESILTYGGASFLVWLLTNTVRELTRTTILARVGHSRWTIFLISIAVSFLVSYISLSSSNPNSGISSIFLENPLNTLFAFFNGCLLFLNALGLQTTLFNQPSEVEQASQGQWTDPW